ncbi:MAG: NAD(P)H-hydrate dehydratase [Candidatus Velthaea sp.]
MHQTRDIDAALLHEWPLPIPAGGDKNARGSISIVAGAAQMPGAAILAATSALRAGCGKLQIGTAASIAGFVATAVPESLVIALEENENGGITQANVESIATEANHCDALTIGPGLVDERATAQLLAALAHRLDIATVIDAGALACFARDPDTFARLHGRIVLTPHAGEMAHMLGRPRESIEADPEACAREAAARCRAVVVLKGERTFIADPGGALYRNVAGHIGLATSGSGDTLAGIIGGLLARGLEPLAAACWGVHAHALAGVALGARIGLGFLAREIPDEIPKILRTLDEGGGTSG